MGNRVTHERVFVWGWPSLTWIWCRQFDPGDESGIICWWQLIVWHHWNCQKLRDAEPLWSMDSPADRVAAGCVFPDVEHFPGLGNHVMANFWLANKYCSCGWLVTDQVHTWGCNCHSRIDRCVLGKGKGIGSLAGTSIWPSIGNRAALSPLNAWWHPGEPDQLWVILDLSFPQGRAVNDSINIKQYLGQDFALHYPMVDHLTARVATLWTTCYMYKHDLACHFHQILVDLGDVSYLGFTWCNQVYFSKEFPMGIHSACLRESQMALFIAWRHWGFGSSITYITFLELRMGLRDWYSCRRLHDMSIRPHMLRSWHIQHCFWDSSCFSDIQI